MYRIITVNNMIPFDKAAFKRQLEIIKIDYSSEIEEIHLAGEGVFIGSKLSKEITTPLRDYVECIVNDRIVGIPVDLSRRIYIKELQ